MTYISISECAARWHVTGRRVRHLCESGRVSGAMQLSGGQWIIPDDAPDPRKPVGNPHFQRKNDSGTNCSDSANQYNQL